MDNTDTHQQTPVSTSSLDISLNTSIDFNVSEPNEVFRYSFLPVSDTQLLSYYQKQKEMMWAPEEIQMKDDRQYWDNLDSNTRRFLTFILAFFAQADGIINENLVENFKKETSDLKEARFFYSAQEFMETIHNETYSLLIETFFRDVETKMRIFDAIHHFDSIRKMSDWIFQWMNKDIPLMQRIVAFACVEGIFFSSAFASIYWIKKKRILPALCKSNEFIARDEAIHTEFAIALYHTYTSKLKKYDLLDNDVVTNIISSAVEVNSEFINDALNVNLIGLNSQDMISYVKCTANSLSKSLGYKQIYNVSNPFIWMAVISLPNKSNFFETTPTEYSKTQSEIDFEDSTDDF